MQQSSTSQNVADNVANEDGTASSKVSKDDTKQITTAITTTEKEQTLCCICLHEPLVDQYCNIDACHHKFCFDCIDSWATTAANTCPLCKKRFHRIVKPITSKDEHSSSVEIKLVAERNQSNQDDHERLVPTSEALLPHQQPWDTIVSTFYSDVHVQQLFRQELMELLARKSRGEAVEIQQACINMFERTEVRAALDRHLPPAAEESESSSSDSETSDDNVDNGDENENHENGSEENHDNGSEENHDYGSEENRENGSEETHQNEEEYRRHERQYCRQYLIQFAVDELRRLLH